MKQILTSIILSAWTAAAALAATPEQEKAFLQAYQKAFEAKDQKALAAFFYTKGADAKTIEMFKAMSMMDAGQKISKIELVKPAPSDVEKYNEPMEMPDGTKYKMPFQPTKLLVISIDWKNENGSGTRSSKQPVGEKDGKLVIPVAVPAK